MIRVYIAREAVPEEILKYDDGESTALFYGRSHEEVQYRKDAVGFFVEMKFPDDDIPASLDRSLIVQVSLRETCIEGRRRPGVYDLNKARGIVDTEIKEDVWDEDAGDRVNKPMQKIRLKGPNLESVIALYHAIRAGKIVPDIPWDGPQVGESKPRELELPGEGNQQE